MSENATHSAPKKNPEAAGDNPFALSLEKVKHIAHLARLYLTDEEAKQIQGHFSGILDYFKVLNSLNTDAVEPMSHSVSLTNAFGKDVPRQGFSPEKALENTPSKRDGLIVVPAVIE